MATFILEKEDTDSIAKILEMLKVANPGWNPRNTMSDFSLAEIGAIEQCFPGENNKFHFNKATF